MNYDCIVLDGAVIVHVLPTTEASTFCEYADKIFIPYLSKQLEHATRIDVVWDTYLPNSLKESTREKGERVFAGKCQAMLNYLATGWTFFVILTIKVNFLPF